MLKKVLWDNYGVLKNLTLDLTDSNGKPYNTIVLAGENGTGKTTILDTLGTFLNLGTFVPFKQIVYSTVLTDYSLVKIKDENFDNGYHTRINLSQRTSENIMSDRYNDLNSILSDREDIRYYGVAYSRARVGFKTESIMNITSRVLDVSKYDNEEDDNFTNIKQLLVDLEAEDCAEWMRFSREGRKLSLSEFEASHSRLIRFKRAFNGFFDGIKFDRVDTDPTLGKIIIFKKGTDDVPIDALSTGEKQIVFRGAQLLRNVTSLNGAVVLIDEPELSLHPLWQTKILKYYRDLFKLNGSQTAQLIVATHSEYVIRSALQDKENVLVIVLKEENDQIIPDRIVAPSVLPGITAAETNYLAFNLASIDYHIELYGYLQEKSNRKTVKGCDDYIKKQSQYDKKRHYKPYLFKNQKYETLCTYIRNCIDHPDSGYKYTEDELRTSILLLRELLRPLIN